MDSGTNHISFLSAVIAGVREVHADPAFVFSPINPFSITEHPKGLPVHKVEGEAWTFYVVKGPHGWNVLGWMEAGRRELLGFDPT